MKGYKFGKCMTCRRERYVQLFQFIFVCSECRREMGGK